jgi:hypothetical protein
VRGGKTVVFIHKKCGQSPDLVKVIEKHLINLLRKLPDGAYRLEIIFDEIDEHEYICDKCNNPLTEEEIVELLKEIHIPEEPESPCTPTT